jgi:hypothetical protein
VTDALASRVRDGGRRALLVGGIGLALGVVGTLFLTPAHFFRSYLLAFLFWVGVGIGCLSLLCIQHLTGGRWGFVIRRLLEAGARTLPFAAIAFLPLALGIGTLYPWADRATVQADPILAHKSVYLNTWFFIARSLFYFGAWSALAFFLTHWSYRLDKGPNVRVERRMRGLAGGALVVLGLTITFSAVDWGMSLEPHWFSTIYGILFMVGQVLQAFTLLILVLAAVREHEPFRRLIDRDVVHDLGKLLLAFVMLWTYIHLSQFLIVWSANLPEEITWYMKRLTGGWSWLAATLIAAHFVLPFLALLSRGLKRNLSSLATVAALVFGARYLDLLWVVGPALGRPHLMLHWMDLALFAGLGGLWLALFARELLAHPVVPQHDSTFAAEPA